MSPRRADTLPRARRPFSGAWQGDAAFARAGLLKLLRGALPSVLLIRLSPVLARRLPAAAPS